MATAQMDTVIRHLRRAVLRQDGAGRTDGQLLASFIDQKDEAAFEALVRRHGPMVFGVCRRVVGNHHDAEDAFQAIFLVLARKASSVRPRERLANWLHGVALRTAMKAKAMTAKRRGREKQVTEMPEPEAAQQDQWRDLQPLLDQELNGLPENYRLPILLCDLEGKTIKEAAQQLGWPQGSLAGRLARGRKLLAKRLACRGVVLSAGSLAAVSQNVASAGVPTSLMSSTVKAAAMIAAGQATVAGAVPAKVAALTEGALKSMMLTKLSKAAVAGLVVLCLCGLGIGGYQASQAQERKTTTTITITTTTTEATPDFLDSSNWHGLKQFWTMKNGSIQGSSGLDQPESNTFLCSRKIYRDFELSFQVRLNGQGWKGNSGVQIRSTLIDPDNYIVRGPQGDMGEGYWGCLYGERSGGMMKQAAWEIADRIVKEGQFNDYYIRCVGKHVTIKVNGVTTVDDRFPQLPEEGIIAWQLHGGKPMTVTFRNVEFRELNVAKSGKTTPTHQLLWHYQSGISGIGAGYFLDEGDGKWVEKNGASVSGVFRFEESTDDYVQLVRTDGGIRVRLPLRGSQSLCKIGDENWRNLYVGGWLSRLELNVANSGKTTPTYLTPQADRVLFRFHDGTSAGYYLKMGNGEWLEHPTGCVFRLEETTDEYMQIIRSDGGIQIRLPFRGGEARCKIGEENWRHLFWGSWLSLPELNVANKAVDNLTTTITTTTVTKQTTPKGAKATEVAEEEQEDMNKSVTAKECFKRLQGTWKVISTTGGGGRQVKTITFSGNRYSFDNNVAPIVTGTFQFVNLTADPKSFDLTNDGGGTAYAIFEIDGDTLYYAGNNDPNARPTDFICRPGDGRYGHICKRVAP
jgi:RNA polymerase sigma factor (sigma-70 family)